MDSVGRFAQVAAATTFGDLSPDAIDSAKRGLVHTFGVALAPTGLVGGPIAPFIQLGRDCGGAAESTAPSGGWRAPVTSASWILGALAHLLDYDDNVDVALTHPSVPVVAAGVPLAERLGQFVGPTCSPRSRWGRTSLFASTWHCAVNRKVTAGFRR
jgi:2-methylcitrate dehydratase PrpD